MWRVRVPSHSVSAPLRGSSCRAGAAELHPHRCRARPSGVVGSRAGGCFGRFSVGGSLRGLAREGDGQGKAHLSGRRGFRSVSLHSQPRTQPRTTCVSAAGAPTDARGGMAMDAGARARGTRRNRLKCSEVEGYTRTCGRAQVLPSVWRAQGGWWAARLSACRRAGAHPAGAGRRVV